MMIGARDLAFPELNLLSWYLLVVGGLFGLFAMLAGGVDTGWTFYTPYTTTYSNSWVIATALGIFIAGFSSILTGLNFIVTVHRMRAPGMTWFRMPLFVWANYATSLIQVLGTPVLAVTIVLLFVRARLPPRHLRSGARRRSGALPAPVLVLLAPGRVHHGAARHGCDQRTDSARSPASRFSATALSPSPASPSRSWASWSGAIICLSAARSVYAGMVFSFLSYFVAIPSAIKVFNWTATLYKGSISYADADAVCASASSDCSPWAA